MIHSYEMAFKALSQLSQAIYYHIANIIHEIIKNVHFENAGYFLLVTSNF